MKFDHIFQLVCVTQVCQRWCSELLPSPQTNDAWETCQKTLQFATRRTGRTSSCVKIPELKGSRLTRGISKVRHVLGFVRTACKPCQPCQPCKLSPSLTEIASPSSSGQNQECSRFLTRVMFAGATCRMLSLRVSMRVDGKLAIDKSALDFSTIEIAHGNLPLMTCICNIAEAKFSFQRCPK